MNHKKNARFMKHFKRFELTAPFIFHAFFILVYLTDAENQIVLTTCHGETTDTFLADMVI